MLGIARAIAHKEYRLLNTGTITSTGAQSYTIPAGTQYIEVEMWGAGGGGGRGNVSSGRGGSTHQAAGGGGGGAYVKHKFVSTNVQASDILNFTVGAGGAGDTNSNGRGVDGGDTSLDTHKRSTTTITTFSSITAGGAVGGKSQGFAVGSSFGDGGEATNGSITNTDGDDGGAQPSSSGSATAGGAGGDAGNGGAGGAGGATGIQSSTMDGNVPGGGGGGGASNANKNGGAGANGKVIVRAYG